jgi:hypothetical protein
MCSHDVLLSMLSDDPTRADSVVGLVMGERRLGWNFRFLYHGSIATIPEPGHDRYAPMQ